MKCDNMFCIYENNSKYLLDEIELDITGLCTSCIYVKIDKSTLKKVKAEAINRIMED